MVQARRHLLQVDQNRSFFRVADDEGQCLEEPRRYPGDRGYARKRGDGVEILCRDDRHCAVAGICDKPGESHESLVRREAVEEAGITLHEVERVCCYMPSPGGSDERLTVFVARADLADAGGIHGHPDEGEDIRVVRVPVGVIESLLDSGLLDNAASIIALQWFRLHKSALDARWHQPD